LASHGVSGGSMIRVSKMIHIPIAMIRSDSIILNVLAITSRIAAIIPVSRIRLK